MKLDHLVLFASDLDASSEFYTILFGELGRAVADENHWENDDGLSIFLRPAKPELKYDRYGPGLNHFAFGVETREAFYDLVARLEKTSISLPDVQEFGDSRSIFIPDPDGLRVEIAFEAKEISDVD
jgi:catechol 2,3-dioxygenase-like lactoylglutathione lyase family enzyme